MIKDPNVELKNADVNFNQYGDDSSAPNQAQAWGMNTKYTGEQTLNSNIPYNANIKTADLDPNYVYGWDAQVANTNEAWYIARRNDNIASALYNEGLRSKEDVIQFLGSQKNWNNSTEADRFNTVESVWKRIWDIAEQNDKDNTEVEVKEMEAEKKEEPKWKDVNVNTFLQGSTTELFGKMITWADTAPYDHNSNEWKKAEARLKQYQKINALSVPQLASSLKAWSILSGWQAMRDLQTYNPEKYQQLQEYQKKEETMNQVNMIASGNTGSSQSLQDQTWESINNYLNETVANAGGDALSRMDLDTALSQNQGLINYAERMSYYQSEINQLDQTISNLADDARRRLSAKTGENVPEYMIQNYINNRSKKLYKQRDNLMNQYNYYKWVYEAQVEQEAQEWERNYKEKQLQLQADKFAWDQQMDQANLWYKYDQLNYDYYKLNGSDPVSDQYLQTWVNSFINSLWDKIANHAKIRSWWCGTVVNDYLKSLGINFQYDDKKSTKINSITPWAWPKVWSIAIWDGSKMGNRMTKIYWHVGIVTSVNDDGTITVLESNEGTWLQYKKYKQANVTWYYDPSASSKKSSKKSEETYTNDELYTQLRGGKIKYADFLKKWNGDESQDQIDDRIANTYFKKSPMNVLSKMSDSVSNLNNMLWDTELAEIYTLEHLNKKDNIISERVAKIVSDYVIDTNKWLSDSNKINLSEYLAIALAWRYKSEKEVKEALNKTKIDYKGLTWKKTSQIAKEIRQEWNW